MNDEKSNAKKLEEICLIVNQIKNLYKMITSESTHLGIALILIACIIAVFTFIAIVYHCYMWSRLKNSVNEIKKVDSQPQSKIYEPIYVKPIVKSMKEYETQVLEMSVPIVDDSISFGENENIYEKIGPNISDLNYVSRNELKVNDLLNGNKSTTILAPNMPKNPLYYEILEESSQTHPNSERLFSGENIYSTTSREKTTEL